MTFEDRIKQALAEQAWIVLCQQQRIEILEQQLRNAQEPKQTAGVSQFPMAVNSTTTQ